MSEPAALAGFIDKWRLRWPEWQVARVFVPVAQRDAAAAWMALLQELTDAAWGGSDATPGLAKLAWWQEELRGWGKGARRHPLGSVLQPLRAPWTMLAGTLLDLQRTRAESSTAEAAMQGLAAFAAAVAQCETALFAAATRPHAAADVVPIQQSLLGARLLGDPDAAWIDVVLLPAPAAGTQVRRIQLALVQARLRRARVDTARVGPLPAVQALWTAWRAARA